MLVGTEKENIIKHVSNLIEGKNKYEKMSKTVNPYGDGKASERVLKILKESIIKSYL